MLVASVVFPAGESERVLGLLRDEERQIEPLRLLAGQLISGVADEGAEAQRYSISGQPGALDRYRKAAVRDDANVIAIRRIASELDDGVATDASSLAGLLQRWRALTPGGARPSGTSFAAVTGTREAIRDSIVDAATTLESRLAEWSARNRAAVVAHERRGVVINAFLVLVALAALLAVFQVARRELRGARRESALRFTAEALARAYSVPDVARRVVDGVMEVVQPADAIVLHVADKSGDLRLAASARAESSLALLGYLDKPYHGSLVENAVGKAAPNIVEVIVGEDGRGRAMIIPLGTPDAPIGSVIALESREHPFGRDDAAWAAIFAQLASLAYEKVRLLEEARAGRARLQRLMDSRGRLFRGFSHDVKNPLGAADGYAALLYDGIYGAVTDEQRASIAHVRDAVHRALSLIDDLHELARAETGHLGIRAEPTDLGALMSQCADEFRAATEAKHLTLLLDVDTELPEVDTDPSRVRQIVGNLLSNAIKYTATGTVTLRVRADGANRPADASHVFVEVEDTGPGIPADKYDLIFEEFARLHGGNHPGAGLGLAISRHVADALGCRLELRSELGKGSTFTVCVPIRAGFPAGSGTEAAANAERHRGARVSSETNEVRST